MLINEVQYKVGLTKKSIRYYESQGLLQVKRNSNNDYREYDEKDVSDLKLIKFLRELNVSILDIKKLKNNELTLKECMQERISKIEESENEFLKIKKMCHEIADKNLEYSTIDISKYSTELNVLNKRGVTLRDYYKSDRNKIIGACISSFCFGIFFAFLAFLFAVLAIKEELFLWIFAIMFLIPLIGIIVNLVKRIQEIRGGEENEASKY